MILVASISPHFRFLFKRQVCRDDLDVFSRLGEIYVPNRYVGFAQKAKIPPTAVGGCVQVRPIHLLCLDLIVTEVNSVDLNHPYTAM